MHSFCGFRYYQATMLIKKYYICFNTMYDMDTIVWFTFSSTMLIKKYCLFQLWLYRRHFFVGGHLYYICLAVLLQVCHCRWDSTVLIWCIWFQRILSSLTTYWKKELHYMIEHGTWFWLRTMDLTHVLVCLRLTYYKISYTFLFHCIIWPRLWQIFVA
jgi:hypothetical protein